ncbi:MAG: GNAT family N-acetyltransferase [Deltaproteobacteria bacterium]|jgi:ribosomal protein S18 acetylase RimI-like enzyme|nr:GNAT family N-acetyltransferase [Deltaproteobacteria bacterium]MBW2534160.1 GNAT family N-acetyltransferase [Deltaproteobacteria bacterium]
MARAKRGASAATLSRVEVRELEIDDLPEVFHLGEKLFTARQVPNLYRMWDEFELVDLYQTEPEYCLVAEAGERIVGFALGTTVEKARSSWKYGYLVWLGVAPSRKQRGIGSKLFREFRARMKKAGVRMLLVDTEASNEQALRFFRKVGFAHPREHVYLSLNLSSPRGKGAGKGKGELDGFPPTAALSRRGRKRLGPALRQGDKRVRGRGA